MKNRTQQLKDILPQIEGNKPTDSVNESFQNDVLRPILKFQNELIIQYFENFLIENKIEFSLLKYSHKITKIHDLFKTNIQFKQFYLGLIVAFFTEKNFEFYVLNKKEVNKRIIAMLIERLCSQIEIIK
jgi:hypothetical protein